MIGEGQIPPTFRLRVFLFEKPQGLLQSLPTGFRAGVDFLFSVAFKGMQDFNFKNAHCAASSFGGQF
jgi:hypothetical protein